MLIAHDESDHWAGGVFPVVPRFSFHELTVAEVVVEQVGAEAYAAAHFRIGWHHTVPEEIRARSHAVWMRKRPWFCSFV